MTAPLLHGPRPPGLYRPCAQRGPHNGWSSDTKLSPYPSGESGHKDGGGGGRARCPHGPQVRVQPPQPRTLDPGAPGPKPGAGLCPACLQTDAACPWLCPQGHVTLDKLTLWGRGTRSPSAWQSSQSGRLPRSVEVTDSEAPAPGQRARGADTAESPERSRTTQDCDP